jgi:hypothetical protein
MEYNKTTTPGWYGYCESRTKQGMEGDVRWGEDSVA